MCRCCTALPLWACGSAALPYRHGPCLGQPYHHIGAGLVIGTALPPYRRGSLRSGTQQPTPPRAASCAASWHLCLANIDRIAQPVVLASSPLARQQLSAAAVLRRLHPVETLSPRCSQPTPVRGHLLVPSLDPDGDYPSHLSVFRCVWGVL